MNLHAASNAVIDPFIVKTDLLKSASLLPR